MTHPSPARRTLLLGTALAAGLVGLPALAVAQSGELNLYSSRHYDTDEALYAEFTEQTGITINRIEAGADELIERMISEGANSPADVLITVDAGRLERADEAGLFQAVDSEVLEERVPEYLQDPENKWFGFSKRARVIMYACDRVENPPRTYEALADEEWRGRLLIRSSTNIYNQSLSGAILAALGEEATEEWSRGIVANMAREPRGGDTDQIRAVAAGEGDLAVSNTYYLGNLLRSDNPEDRAVAEQICVVFPNQDDRGTHVNISGAGVAANAPNPEAAKLFLEYLASDSAQAYFAEGNSEYPVVEGVAAPEWIQRFGEFQEDDLSAETFAQNNADALMVMDRAGWK
ncbi:Fe(3+) ABC transporter substrate-binding protein [Salinarimonas sp. NSM]|uniref:Fe(3+) ABC transporter substrate-binding protein n=1 Tax=Salinarimonas sp. NSM TaxID=3458003 RepID=UPI0040373676